MIDKMIISDKYFVKEYDKSIMFKAPSPYHDRMFFHNKNYVNKVNDEYELTSNDSFMISLRNTNGDEKHITLKELKELYSFEQRIENSNWSIEYEQDGYVIMIGDEYDEYLIGKLADFEKNGDTYKVLDKNKYYYTDSYIEAQEFAINYQKEKDEGILNSKEELLYQSYVEEQKETLFFGADMDRWYEYIIPRAKWKEENKELLAQSKMSQYKNSKAYEKSIPYALRSRKQFIVWKWVYDHLTGLAKKFPLKPWNIREGASSTDSSHWATFEKACDVVNKYGEKYKLAGIGIMFGKGVMGIDFDHCFKNGVCEKEKQYFVDKIDSYTELSPSGEGLHIITFGNLPKEYRHRNDPEGVEVYDTARFFTLTGTLYEGKVRKIKSAEATSEALVELAERYLKKPVFENKPRKNRATNENNQAKTNGLNLTDEKILDLIRKSVRSEAFSALFDRGEVPLGRNGLLNINCMKKKTATGSDKTYSTNKEILNDYELDHSKCDTMLCGILASYSDKPEQIDRIFRQSKLMRAKWDSVRGNSTYGANVCDWALNTVSWKYTGKQHKKKTEINEMG